MEAECICPNCEGRGRKYHSLHGKLTEDPNDLRVCTVCEGYGTITEDKAEDYERFIEEERACAENYWDIDEKGKFDLHPFI